jgi:glycogen debranching enzyme
MKDKIFTTTKGDYVGNDSWSGNVWTLINEMVVRGLLDSGEKELGVELALKTIYAFNDNYTEFINPFDGSGHGVKEYAWTASQYLTLIIECIFGISYNESMDEVKAEPNLNQELKGEILELNDITLSKGKRLNIVINKGSVSIQ